MFNRETMSNRRKGFFFVKFTVLFLLLLSINTIDVSAAKLINKGLYAQDDVTIVINEEEVTFNDLILNKDGHLLLPMRDFYESIDAQVSWDQETQTASSNRNGRNVDLKINSTIANVDGKNVSMAISALLYKDRTYIPLRFVSETFDGTVNWDATKQEVKVSLDSKPTKPEIDENPLILHINNKRVSMSEPAIIKDGRTFIPAHYFYKNLDGSFGKWNPNKEYELQVMGLNFIFSADSNFVLVNQEPVTIEDKPFLQSGMMYVPVNFIVDSLGGSMRKANNNNLYLFFNDYMFVSDFLTKNDGLTARPVPVIDAYLEGTRDMLISDNPETLKETLIPNQTATLAEYTVSKPAGTNEHRVFGWHLNHLSSDVAIGITIENTSETTSIEIIESKGFNKISINSWVNYDVGLPIADRVLSNELETSQSKGIIIEPGETKTIEAFDLHQEEIVGFIHDLDIRSEGASDYIIRTVLAKNGQDLSTIKSEAVPLDPTVFHPRGAWAYSEIATDLPTYKVGSSEVGYNISNGQTDYLLTAENSLFNPAKSTGNRGHFGMTYKVNIPILNPVGKSETIKIKLAARGGTYSGAVKINDQVYLIPILKAAIEFVELPEQVISGRENTISLEVMHAGGSNMPLAIYIESK